MHWGLYRTVLSPTGKRCRLLISDGEGTAREHPYHNSLASTWSAGTILLGNLALLLICQFTDQGKKRHILFIFVCIELLCLK